MPISIAQGQTAELLMDRATAFFGALMTGNLEEVWHRQISRESAALLACSIFPAYAESNGTFAKLMRQTVAEGQERTILQGLAFAFHQDADEIRTQFFQGMAKGLERSQWHEFDRSQSIVFVDGAAAVLIGDAGPKASVLPFVHDPDLGWLVDMEAWAIFSQTSVTAELLYAAAKTAEREGAATSAFALFELTAALQNVHGRIRRLLLDNTVASTIITDERIGQLGHDAEFALLARHEVLLRLSADSDLASDIDMAAFLRTIVDGYDTLDVSSVTEADIQKLYALPDNNLRLALATLIRGVDPLVAQREARKPHGPAEVSDMELPIRFDGRLVYLCIPFKSGREVRTARVPVEIAYQATVPASVTHRGESCA